MSLCVVCSSVISKRHHALECDNCKEWCHRLCQEGKSYIIFVMKLKVVYNIFSFNYFYFLKDITYKEYKVAVKSNQEISFCCPKCKQDTNDINDTILSSLISEKPVISNDEMSEHQANTVIFNDSMNRVIQDVIIDDNIITYTKLEGQSKRNKTILIDSVGYKYNIKER